MIPELIKSHLIFPALEQIKGSGPSTVYTLFLPSSHIIKQSMVTGNIRMHGMASFRDLEARSLANG